MYTGKQKLMVSTLPALVGRSRCIPGDIHNYLNIVCHVAAVCCGDKKRLVLLKECGSEVY